MAYIPLYRRLDAPTYNEVNNVRWIIIKLFLRGYRNGICSRKLSVLGAFISVFFNRFHYCVKGIINSVISELEGGEEGVPVRVLKNISCIIRNKSTEMGSVFSDEEEQVAY